MTHPILILTALVTACAASTERLPTPEPAAAAAELYAPIAALSPAARVDLEARIDAMPLTEIIPMLEQSLANAPVTSMAAAEQRSLAPLASRFANLAHTYPTIGALAKGGHFPTEIPGFGEFSKQLQVLQGIPRPSSSLALVQTAYPIDSGYCNNLHNQYEAALGVTRYQIGKTLTLASRHQEPGSRVAFTHDEASGIVQVLATLVSTVSSVTNSTTSIQPNIYGNPTVEAWNSNNGDLAGPAYLQNCFFWR